MVTLKALLKPSNLRVPVFLVRILILWPCSLRVDLCFHCNSTTTHGWVPLILFLILWSLFKSIFLLRIWRYPWILGNVWDIIRTKLKSVKTFSATAYFISLPTCQQSFEGTEPLNTTTFKGILSFSFWGSEKRMNTEAYWCLYPYSSMWILPGQNFSPSV